MQKKAGRHTGWLSYTLSRTELTSHPGGRALPGLAGPAHELKLVDSARLGKWTLSGTWIFATGKPYTAATASPRSRSATETGRSASSSSGRRTARACLPTTASTSPCATTTRKDARGDLGVTVFNVYDRHNVWYKEYQAFDTALVENDVT